MITPSSLAAGNQVGIKNVQFESLGQILKRKIVIVGSYDPAKLDIVDNVPERFLSAGSVAAKYGFGSMLHRLAIKAFLGSKGIETWVIPQPEAGGAAAATGKLGLVGAATADGVLALYIGGEIAATINVSTGDTAIAMTAALVAAYTNQDIPALATIDGINAFETNIDAKAKGTFGNSLDISLNLDGQLLPAGTVPTITPMAGGLTNPDIQNALNAMGLNDNQNEKHFTALIHGYGQDAANLNAIATYNGLGNDFVGNYAKTVARPFRSLFGDTAVNEAGLLALIAYTDTVKEDRTNGVAAAPGSQSHPEEIAALTMGLMELVNTTRAEETYINRALSTIRVGDAADRWTDEYDNRDTAVKAGISPTLVQNGVLTLQNVVSHYRPDAVASESNGYRSMRNISIIQNLLNSQRLAFAQEKWQGITIVEDVVKVANTTSRLKARDVNTVLDELVALALNYEGLAWIFSSSFTLDQLKQGDKVVLRPAGNGFDVTFPVVLSGEGGILNQVIEFDTSLAVFL